MKKLLASLLCLGLICGMGLSTIGCKKAEDKKGTPPAEKKGDTEKKGG